MRRTMVQVRGFNAPRSSDLRQRETSSGAGSGPAVSPDAPQQGKSPSITTSHAELSDPPTPPRRLSTLHTSPTRLRLRRSERVVLYPPSAAAVTYTDSHVASPQEEAPGPSRPSLHQTSRQAGSSAPAVANSFIRAMQLQQEEAEEQRPQRSNSSSQSRHGSPPRQAPRLEAHERPDPAEAPLLASDHGEEDVEASPSASQHAFAAEEKASSTSAAAAPAEENTPLNSEDDEALDREMAEERRMSADTAFTPHRLSGNPAPVYQQLPRLSDDEAGDEEFAARDCRTRQMSSARDMPAEPASDCRARDEAATAAAFLVAEATETVITSHNQRGALSETSLPPQINYMSFSSPAAPVSRPRTTFLFSSRKPAPTLPPLRSSEVCPAAAAPLPHRARSASVPPSAPAPPVSASAGRPKRTCFTLTTGPAVKPARAAEGEPAPAPPPVAAAAGAVRAPEAKPPVEADIGAEADVPPASPRSSASDTFYDLPAIARGLFALHRGLVQLYPWQHEVLTRPDVRAGGSLVYSLPTSGGKTLVAEICLLRCAINRGRSCLFVLPYVSLAEEKTLALQALGDAFDLAVDGHYGAVGRFPLARTATVWVCTIEKSNSILNYLLEEGRAHEIGTVVVDELHMLSEPRRGATLELMLSKVLMLSDASHERVQIIGMSATIPNLPALARWLQAAYYIGDYRPVPLHQYSVVDGMVLRDGERNERNLTHAATEVAQLLELATEIPEASVLIFCASRRQCVETARGVARYMLSVAHTGAGAGELQRAAPPAGRVPASLPPEAAAAVEMLLADLESLGHAEASSLAEVIPWGVAYHHGGLLAEERELIERAYRLRYIRILCCTSTLAAGVNLPARRVIFRSPYVGRTFISPSRYAQMCGRAGRAGLDTFGESFLLLSRRDRVRGHELMKRELEPCTSRMFEELACFTRALLECVGVGLAQSQRDAMRWCGHLLANTAAGPLDAAAVSILRAHLESPGGDLSAADGRAPPPPSSGSGENSMVSPPSSCIDAEVQQRYSVPQMLEVLLAAAVVELTQHGLIRTRLRPPPRPEDDAKAAQASCGSDGEHSCAEPRVTDDGLEVTPFGASSVRSCFSVEEAVLVRDELDQLRQTGLILADDLHMCYFLTPLREIGDCDWWVYRTVLARLNDSRQRIAAMIGVDEHFVDQRAMGLGGPPHAVPTSKEELRKLFTARRFYLALMLAEVLAEVPLHEVEERYGVQRGQLQSLMRSASMFSSSITSFCHAMEWYSLEAVLASFVKRLGFGVKPDIVPLMEIRGVQPARARALWNAGFRDPASIAACAPSELVAKVKQHNLPENKSAKFMTTRSAVMLVREANLLLQGQIREKRGELKALTGGVGERR